MGCFTTLYKPDGSGLGWGGFFGTSESFNFPKGANVPLSWVLVNFFSPPCSIDGITDVKVYNIRTGEEHLIYSGPFPGNTDASPYYAGVSWDTTGFSSDSYAVEIKWQPISNANTLSSPPGGYINIYDQPTDDLVGTDFIEYEYDKVILKNLESSVSFEHSTGTNNAGVTFLNPIGGEVFHPDGSIIPITLETRGLLAPDALISVWQSHGNIPEMGQPPNFGISNFLGNTDNENLTWQLPNTYVNRSDYFFFAYGLVPNLEAMGERLTNGDFTQDLNVGWTTSGNGYSITRTPSEFNYDRRSNYPNAAGTIGLIESDGSLTASYGLTGEIRVYKVDIDGNDIGPYLQGMRAGQTLKLQNMEDTEAFGLYELTDVPEWFEYNTTGTEWYKILVNVIDSNGGWHPPSEDNKLILNYNGPNQLRFQHTDVVEEMWCAQPFDVIDGATYNVTFDIVNTQFGLWNNFKVKIGNSANDDSITVHSYDWLNDGYGSKSFQFSSPSTGQIWISIVDGQNAPAPPPEGWSIWANISVKGENILKSQYGYSQHVTFTRSFDALPTDNVKGSDSVEFRKNDNHDITLPSSSFSVATLVSKIHKIINRFSRGHISYPSIKDSFYKYLSKRNIESVDDTVLGSDEALGTPTFFQHILNTQTDKPSIGDDQSHHLSIHFTKNQTEPSISLKDSFSYEYRSSHLTQNLEPSLFTIQEDVGLVFGDVQNLSFETSNSTGIGDDQSYHRSVRNEIATEDDLKGTDVVSFTFGDVAHHLHNAIDKPDVGMGFYQRKNDRFLKNIIQFPGLGDSMTYHLSEHFEELVPNELTVEEAVVGNMTFFNHFEISVTEYIFLADNRYIRKSDRFEILTSDDVVGFDEFYHRVNAKLVKSTDDKPGIADDVGYVFGDVQNLLFQVKEDIYLEDIQPFHQSLHFIKTTTNDMGIDDTFGKTIGYVQHIDQETIMNVNLKDECTYHRSERNLTFTSDQIIGSDLLLDTFGPVQHILKGILDDPGFSDSTAYHLSEHFNKDAIGQNLVLNGDFLINQYWIYQTGWSYDNTNKKAQADGSGYGEALYPSIGFDQDLWYELKYEITDYESGELKVNYDVGYGSVSESYGPSRTSDGVYTEFRKLTSNGFFYFISFDFKGKIDNVSLKSVDMVNVVHGVGLSYRSAHHIINTDQSLKVVEVPYYDFRAIGRHFKATEDISNIQDTPEVIFNPVNHFSKTLSDSLRGTDDLVFNLSRPFTTELVSSLVPIQDPEKTHYGLEWDTTLPSALIRGSTYALTVQQRADLVGSGQPILFQYGLSGGTLIDIGTSEASPTSTIYWTVPEDLAHATNYVIIARLTDPTAEYNDNVYAESPQFIVRSEHEYGTSNDIFIGNYLDPTFRVNDKFDEDIGDDVIGSDDADFEIKFMYHIDSLQFLGIGEDRSYYLSEHRLKNIDQAFGIGESVAHVFHDSHHEGNLLEKPTLEDVPEVIIGYVNHFLKNYFDTVKGLDYFTHEHVHHYEKDMLPDSVEIQELVSVIQFRHRLSQFGSELLIQENAEYEFGDHTYVIDLTDKMVVGTDKSHNASTPIEKSTSNSSVVVDTFEYEFVRRISEIETDKVVGSDEVDFYASKRHIINLTSTLSPKYVSNDLSPWGEGGDLEYLWEGFTWVIPYADSVESRLGVINLSFTKHSNFNKTDFSGAGDSYTYFTIGDGTIPPTESQDLIYFNALTNSDTTDSSTAQNFIAWWPEGNNGVPTPIGSTIITECSDQYNFWVRGVGKCWKRLGYIAIRESFIKTTSEEIFLDDEKDHHSHPHNRWNITAIDSLIGNTEANFFYRSHELGPYLTASDPALSDDSKYNYGKKLEVEDDVKGLDEVSFSFPYIRKQTSDGQAILDSFEYIFGDVANLLFNVEDNVSLDDPEPIKKIGHVVDLNDTLSPTDADIKDNYGFTEDFEDIGYLDDETETAHRIAWHFEYTIEYQGVYDFMQFIHRLMHRHNMESDLAVDEDIAKTLGLSRLEPFSEQLVGTDDIDYFFLHTKLSSPLEGSEFNLLDTTSIQIRWVTISSKAFTSLTYEVLYNPNDGSDPMLISNTINTTDPVKDITLPWVISGLTPLSDNANIKMNVSWKPVDSDDILATTYSPHFALHGYAHILDLNSELVMGENARHNMAFRLNTIDQIIGSDNCEINFRSGWRFEVEDDMRLMDDASDGEIYGITVVSPNQGASWQYNHAINIMWYKRIRNRLDEAVRLYYSPTGEWDTPPERPKVFIAEVPPNPNGYYWPTSYNWIVPNDTPFTDALPNGARIILTSIQKITFNINETISMSDNIEPQIEVVNLESKAIGIAEEVSHMQGKDIVKPLSSGLNVYDFVEVEIRTGKFTFNVLSAFELDDNMVIDN